MIGRHIIPVDLELPCSLLECPPGLFLCDGTLGFKSEYSSMPGHPEAFCVDSGEFFWGGANAALERAGLIVQPITLVYEAASGESPCES